MGRRSEEGGGGRELYSWELGIPFWAYVRVALSGANVSYEEIYRTISISSLWWWLVTRISLLVAISDLEFTEELHHDEMLAVTGSFSSPNENDIVQDIISQYDAKGIKVRAK